jgi:hypothetical protein
MVKGCWIPSMFVADVMHVTPLQMPLIWFPWALEFDPPKSSSPKEVVLD